MKAGIQHHVLDYLLKPVDHTRLEHILDILVQRLLERHILPMMTRIFSTIIKIDYDDYYVNQILSQIKQHYHKKVTVLDLN